MNLTQKEKEDFSAVRALLKKSIPAGGTIVLGFSGGPDSAFLLEMCLRVRKNHRFNIIIAHVDHGLRDAESRNDAIFAEKTARKHALTFELLNIVKRPSGNLENGLRGLRYTFFEKIRKKHKADLVLTAHHLNDNIETIILNLTRGCHLDGLCGMDVYDKKRHLLRPLLSSVGKREILHYLKKNNIPYRLDATNLDTKFSRNLVRHKIIPELEKINKNLGKTFLTNIKNFRALRNKQQSNLAAWLEKNETATGIATTAFLDLDTRRQRDVIFALYKNRYGNVNGLAQNHVSQLIAIIGKDRAGLKKEFGPRFNLIIAKAPGKAGRRIQILKKTAKQVQ